MENGRGQFKVPASTVLTNGGRNAVIEVSVLLGDAV